MTSIRPTIEFVCSLLARFGISNVSPEVIRQSKFNSNDESVRITLWRVLHGVCLLIDTDFHPACWARVHDATQRTSDRAGGTGDALSSGADRVFSISGSAQSHVRKTKSKLDAAWEARESDEAALAYIQSQIQNIFAAAYVAPMVLHTGPRGQSDDHEDAQENTDVDCSEVEVELNPESCSFLYPILTIPPERLWESVSSSQLLLTFAWVGSVHPHYNLFERYAHFLIQDITTMLELPPYRPDPAFLFLYSTEAHVPENEAKLVQQLTVTTNAAKALLSRVLGERSDMLDELSAPITKILREGVAQKESAETDLTAPVSGLETYCRTRARQILSAASRADAAASAGLDALTRRFVLQEQLQALQSRYSQISGDKDQESQSKSTYRIRSCTETLFRGQYGQSAATAIAQRLAASVTGWIVQHGPAGAMARHESLWWAWCGTVAESNVERIIEKSLHGKPDVPLRAAEGEDGEVAGGSFDSQPPLPTEAVLQLVNEEMSSTANAVDRTFPPIVIPEPATLSVVNPLLAPTSQEGTQNDFLVELRSCLLHLIHIASDANAAVPAVVAGLETLGDSETTQPSAVSCEALSGSPFYIAPSRMQVSRESSGDSAHPQPNNEGDESDDLELNDIDNHTIDWTDEFLDQVFDLRKDYTEDLIKVKPFSTRID